MNLLGKWPGPRPADRLLVCEHPWATLQEVSGASGLGPRAALNAWRHLRMEGWAGKVREGRVGHYAVNLASPDVRAILFGA